jgi:hypothetical protein
VQCFSTTGPWPGTRSLSYFCKNLPGQILTKVEHHRSSRLGKLCEEGADSSKGHGVSQETIGSECFQVLCDWPWSLQDSI